MYESSASTDTANTQEFIDLRSDTVTKPSPEMRRAMFEAEVGDDVYAEDPTINKLEARAAEIFGREAALFVPSGTMGNQIAIKLHTTHGQEVVCEERSHVFAVGTRRHPHVGAGEGQAALEELQPREDGSGLRREHPQLRWRDGDSSGDFR